MNNLRYLYRTYGMTWACNAALPCIAAASDMQPDFIVRFAGRRPLPPVPEQAQRSLVTGEFRWTDDRRQEHVRFIDPLDGSRLEFAIDLNEGGVDVLWDGNTVVEDIPRVLLGVISGRLLQLRGVPTLHANAIDIDGGAALFCGQSGAGKSSMTAALVATGHPLLSDDIAALQESGEGLQVAHGHPHLRLWPDSAQTLGPDWQELPLVFNRTETMGDKCYRDLGSSSKLFSATDLPLRAVYLLTERRAALDKAEIIALPPHQAVPQLLRNLFVAQGALAPFLPAMAKLADRYPVFSVRQPDGLHRMSETAAQISEHAREGCQLAP